MLFVSGRVCLHVQHVHAVVCVSFGFDITTHVITTYSSYSSAVSFCVVIGHDYMYILYEAVARAQYQCTNLVATWLLASDAACRVVTSYPERDTMLLL